MEAKNEIRRAVHHSTVQLGSLYLCLGVRPGSGRKNTDRDMPSRGSRDSVKVGGGGSSLGGGESSDEGGVGVGERDGRGEVW